MNKILVLLLVGCVFSLVTLTSCGDDDGPQIDPVDALTEDLTFTWNPTSVSFEGEDRTDQYTGFSLTISEGSQNGGNYSTTEVAVRDPWPNSGSWEFQNPDNITVNTTSFNIVRNDGLVISVTLSNEGNNMSMVLNNYDEDTHEGAKTAAVNGSWTFEFTRAN